MSETGKKLRDEARVRQRLADIADALEPTFGEVEFSPISAWEVSVEDEDGNMVAVPLDVYLKKYN